MTWVEIGETSLPQAQMLLAEYGEVDGNREAARYIVESMIDLAVAGGLVKRKSASVTGPTPPRKDESEVLTGTIIIDELAEVLKRSGWTSPAE